MFETQSGNHVLRAKNNRCGLIRHVALLSDTELYDSGHPQETTEFSLFDSIL
jgi:hypothetical protein